MYRLEHCILSLAPSRPKAPHFFLSDGAPQPPWMISEHLATRMFHETWLVTGATFRMSQMSQTVPDFAIFWDI